MHICIYIYLYIYIYVYIHTYISRSHSFFQVARIFNDVRAFRVYDGTSEVHRMSLGRTLKLRKPKPS